MLIAEGRDPKQAAAIAYEKAGRKPKANAQELTYEYLKAFYDHVMEHPQIFKELTDEIHIKSRAKAGGKLHGKEQEAWEIETMSGMKTNASKWVSIRINGKESPDAETMGGNVGSISLNVIRTQLDKDLPFDNYEVEDPAKFAELSKVIIAALGDVSPTGGILRNPENLATLDKLVKNNALRINASSFGGKVIDATDEITIIPAVLMAEGVRNGGLHRYEDFSRDVRWFEGVPIVPPHLASDPVASLVNQHTSKLGQIRNVKLNADKRRVEAEAVLFNHKFNPDDLARIKSGEAFGGSIGFFADDEMLPEKQTWHDGKEYNRIEKNFFGNHFSIVADPACPLGTCGFNVNAKIEANEMTEIPKPAETPKVNAEEKPEGTPNINVEAPKVNVAVDLSTVLNKLDALSSDFAAFKTNAAAKDAEIAALKAAEEVRVNAQKAAEDALVLSTLGNMLLPAFKDKAAEMLPAFKGNAALWIAQNPDKIDLAAFTKPATIVPAGQAFVPHVNAADEEAEFSALGVASPEDIGKAMKGVI